MKILTPHNLMGNIFCYDLVLKILTHVVLSDLIQMSLSSKNLHKYMMNPLFWQIIVDKCDIIENFIKYILANYEKNTYSYPIHNIKNFYTFNKKAQEINVYGLNSQKFFSFPI